MKEAQFEMDFEGVPDPMHFPGWQRFMEWVHTPGGRHIAKDCFAMAAGYAQRRKRTGRRVSIKLIWETERDRISWVRKNLRRRKIHLEQSYGYTLNNDYHSFMARFIVQKRPEWNGLFEFREQGTPRTGRSTRMEAA